MAKDDKNTKVEIDENFQFLLPYGEILRTIVIDTALSDSDLKLVLKQKGIFLSRYDRNDSVPALMRTILSPNQFDELQDMRSEKIDKEKYRTSQIPWTGTNDLLGSLPKSFNLAEILESQFKYQTNTKLLGIPKFVKVDGRKDKVICNYEIEEELAMMSYHNRKKVYQGSLQLELKNDENLVLHTVKTFTSPLTMDLSKRVEKDLEKHFKAEKKIEKEETFEKILFSNFNNKNRFKFFMNFLSDIDFFELQKRS